MSFVDNLHRGDSRSDTFLANTPPTDLDLTLPPPYSSDESVNNNQRTYTPPTMEHTEPPSLDQPSFSLLELNLFQTCNSPTPYYSTCVIEQRFLLLGHCTNGLQVLDMKDGQTPPKTIMWIQARQLKAISSCSILLVLPERTKKVRCYSLAAILRLCYGVLGLYWTPQCDHIFSLGDKTSWWTTNDDLIDPSRSSVVLSAIPTNNPSPLKLNGTINKRYLWKDGEVLQDYCYKLPNSKDALSMHIYSTTGYVFVAVLQRDRILLWQRQRHSSANQVFSPLKEFWIPAEAQAVSFADDRITLRHLIAVFPHGATLIGIQSSKVKTVPIDKKVEELYQAACLKQHYESYGRPATTTNETNHLASTSLSIFTRSSSNPPTSPISPPPAPRRPLSFTTPSLQWTSLIQLPFYPERMASLTVEFSIPPSYTTVMTRTPFEATDPVAVPSATAPQLFLATFGCQSMIIDMTGALFSTQIYSWSEPPESHIAFITLRPGDWYAVGFAKESVNVMHMASGKSHRVMNGVPIRFLGHSSYRGGTLFWSCVNGKINQIYSLSGSSP